MSDAQYGRDTFSAGRQWAALLQYARVPDKRLRCARQLRFHAVNHYSEPDATGISSRGTKSQCPSAHPFGV
jgi:hypothetical protein